MLKRFSWLACFGAAFLCAGAAGARSIDSLDYQRRFDDSVLVVIATPTAKSADTKEISHALGLYRQDQDGTSVAIDAIGLETPFNVSLTLKGDKAVRQFVLHHYRLSNEFALEGGPHLFTVGDFDTSADGSTPKDRSSYLMFLLREPDGRYAPADGQLDPAYEAIFPLPFERR